MKIKQLLTKTLLVAALLMVGASNVWADDGTTWTFTDNATWGSVDLTAGKMYNNTAGEVLSGGVTLNFESEKAVWKISKTSRLWFTADGPGTTQPTANYIQLTVPNGYRVTVTGYGHSSTRKSYYTINGTAGTSTGTAVTTNDLQYDNETGGDVVFTFWPGNATKNGSSIMGVDAINLRDVSSVVTHKYSVSAKCDEVEIDSWEVTEIEEGAEYSVPAKAYITKDSKFYVLDDVAYTGTASGNYNGHATTMGASDAEYTINYTEDTSSGIVYFREGETISNPGNISTASNGKHCGYMSTPVSVTLVEAGLYELVANVTGRSTNSSLEIYTADGTESFAQIAKSGSTNEGIRSCQFVASAGQIVRYGGPYYDGKFQNSLSFDYVIIRKIGPASVSKEISSAGWATYCSPYALDFRGEIADLTDAYIITGADGDVVTTESVKGGTVAANTGLLIKGSEGTITIPVEASGTNYSGVNKLEGVTSVKENVPAGIYVLLDGGDGVGFYKTLNPFTVGANTAYLPDSFTYFSSGAPTFYGLFEDNITGIKAIDNGQLTIDNCFDLQGRRVAQPTKGLYIVNGKKVVIK